MTNIEGIKLELVRPGPRYGQLLSRLTDYVALCDGAEADTVRLPFDHYEIQADLASLQYFVGSENGGRIPNDLRADAVERLGHRIADTFAQMCGFQTRLAEAGGAAELTHLRLVLGGGELSLIPFEISWVPPGWRGAGGKLSLQSRAPIVVTRELRDSVRIPLDWNRRPRVLFCTACPKGFAPPPAKAHLLAIVGALKPWIDEGREGRRKLKIGDVVTVLEDASLCRIQEETERREYTHVHLLCHGCALPQSGERMGLALAKPRRPEELDPVNAAGLANALWSKARTSKPPTMVVLASCDSANQMTVESPGASVAYELHQAGVPWVVASQMPLTFQGSATLTRTFYEGILAGIDPRCVLYEVRDKLARDHEAHDWASMVAYSAFPHDFDSQVLSFRIRQLRRFIDSAFERMRLNPSSRDSESRCIDDYFAQWGRVMPQRKGRNDPAWSEYFGMKGAICKQKAEFQEGEKAILLLEEAADSYLDAGKTQPGNHWVVVQYLSLSLLLKRKVDSGLFQIAERSAILDWEEGAPDDRAWAAGSLMEIAILSQTDDKAMGKTHIEWAEELVRLTKPGSFVRFSTRRQLDRYIDGQFKDRASEEVRNRATQARKRLPHEAD